jgi:hypothetical protein
VHDSKVSRRSVTFMFVCERVGARLARVMSTHGRKTAGR